MEPMYEWGHLMVFGLVVVLGFLFAVCVVTAGVEWVVARVRCRRSRRRACRSFADAVADMDFERAEAITRVTLRDPSALGAATKGRAVEGARR